MIISKIKAKTLLSSEVNRRKPVLLDMDSMIKNTLVNFNSVYFIPDERFGYLSSNSVYEFDLVRTINNRSRNIKVNLWDESLGILPQELLDQKTIVLIVTFYDLADAAAHIYEIDDSGNYVNKNLDDSLIQESLIHKGVFINGTLTDAYTLIINVDYTFDSMAAALEFKAGKGL